MPQWYKLVNSVKGLANVSSLTNHFSNPVSATTIVLNISNSGVKHVHRDSDAIDEDNGVILTLL